MEDSKGKFYYAAISLLACISLFCGCQKKKRVVETTLPRGNYDLVKMANGAIVNAYVIPSEGTNTALLTATTANAYDLQLTLNVAIPAAAMTVKDLCAATPELTAAFPKLEEMLPENLSSQSTAAANSFVVPVLAPSSTSCTLGYSTPLTPVSSSAAATLNAGAKIDPKNFSQEKNKASTFYTTLFENKIKALQHQLSHLGQLFPRESLYDCQTILTLTNKQNGHHALLVQAIMNVNADGSDGDRNIPLEKLSSTYQPQTNYRWPKISSHLNPNLPALEEQLRKLQEAATNTPRTLEQKNKIQDQIKSTEQMISELQRWSFLIGSADPFIVLPKFMLDPKNTESAAIGDYAVVLYQGILYPAIVGDIGPSSKIGEASLRLCRAIDPASGAERRPVSSPHVSYFIFSKSAELPMTAPNYAHWSERCHQLWNDLGGSSSLAWHEWTNLEQPWPEEKKSEPIENENR